MNTNHALKTVTNGEPFLKLDLFETYLNNFPIRSSSNSISRTFFMPTTRKQKKARKSREQDMLSDIENLDIMLGGNSLDREEYIKQLRQKA